MHSNVTSMHSHDRDHPMGRSLIRTLAKMVGYYG